MSNLKKHFLGLDETIHFYSGAESPMLKTSIDVMTSYLHDKSLGEIGRERHFQVEKELKENIGRLINASPHEIAFSGNASDGINHIIRALPIKPGDNVILNDLEYASVYLPWLQLKEKYNIEIRLVQSENGAIDPERIKEQMDERTCLVAVSHVSYLNGYRHSLQTLRQMTKQMQIPLLVDATQSLGVLPVNSAYFDFMVASSYKWLLGTHGLGIMYISSDVLHTLQIDSIGWRSVQSIFGSDRFTHYELKEDATRFEAGFNNYPAIYVLKNSTDFLLNIQVKKIEKHIIHLGNILFDGLEQLGLQILSPTVETARSGNISFKAENGEEVMKQLAKQNIKVWGGDRRVRVSINLFNNISDVEMLITHLEKLKHQQVL